MLQFADCGAAFPESRIRSRSMVDHGQIYQFLKKVPDRILVRVWQTGLDPCNNRDTGGKPAGVKAAGKNNSRKSDAETGRGRWNMSFKEPAPQHEIRKNIEETVTEV